MKKFLLVILSAALSAIILFGGCVMRDGRDGRDGKDGQDVSVYDLYETAKSVEGNENLTLDEFLKEYLTYDDSEIQETASLKAAINRSLLSGVAILSRFAYSSGTGSVFSRTSYKVYSGSGAILWLDKEAGDAYVVTNCHVVYDDTADVKFCNDVRLYLYGQDVSGVNYIIDEYYNISGDENYRINAEIIGISVSYDIALLKVSGSEVLKRSSAVVSTFSEQTSVHVGDTVYAIGNASNEGISASEGIISRDSEQVLLTLSNKTSIFNDDYNYYRVMRTTAPLNHGNSGGALYNTHGEIIGIVNSKDDSDGVDNMGYALPAGNVKRLLKLMYDDYVANGYKLASGGGVNKAILNITTKITDSYSVYENGVAEIYEQTAVEKVYGAPSMGSLQDNDYLKSVIITDSDGVVKESFNITRDYQLSDAMLSVRKGDTVSLTVERNGEELTIPVVYDSNRYFEHYD